MFIVIGFEESKEACEVCLCTHRECEELGGGHHIKRP